MKASLDQKQVEVEIKQEVFGMVLTATRLPKVTRVFLFNLEIVNEIEHQTKEFS
jgi:hypothetical protein